MRARHDATVEWPVPSPIAVIPPNDTLRASIGEHEHAACRMAALGRLVGR
jgi:hypothetical protein